MEDYKEIYAPHKHWVGRGTGTPKDEGYPEGVMT
jgi:hypothetical protein